MHHSCRTFESSLGCLFGLVGIRIDLSNFAGQAALPSVLRLAMPIQGRIVQGRGAQFVALFDKFSFLIKDGCDLLNVVLFYSFDQVCQLAH